MLEFLKVTKSYGGRIILQIPFFQVPAGISWLKGPNGSGKTSVLRMVCGLIPFKGDITLHNISLKHAPLDYRRTVSWADAEPQYPGFLKGRDLVDFYLPIRKSTPRAALQLADQLNGKQMLGQLIDSYSSGMLKKLSLLLAFVGNPALICLDEPLTSLDEETIPAVFTLIKEKQQSGSSFLLSSHQELPTTDISVDQQFLLSGQTLKPIL